MEYEILDPIVINSKTETLISQCYDLWKSVYDPILSTAGEKIIPEMFYRAKLISVIHEKNEVLAFTLHNNLYLGLNGTSDLSYLSIVPKIVLNDFKNQKKSIMTIEWVTANPSIRGRFTKIQPGEVIVGLAMRLVKATPWDSVMGFSRTDLKADKTAAKFGAYSLGLTKRHNIECEIMYAEKENIKQHPFAKVESIINDCWNKKINHSPYIKNDAVLNFENSIAA